MKQRMNSLFLVSLLLSSSLASSPAGKMPALPFEEVASSVAIQQRTFGTKVPA
jgi:hypothetical protein